ncbi:hypothetical protein ABZ543_08015 [Streptomyces roseifaciens]
MMTDFLSLGEVEVVNHVRLNAYLESVGSPLTSRSVCVCPTLTAEMLGDEPYTDPETDQAPWFDADVPESAEFAGFLLLSVEGLDDYPVKRTVSNAITGGGSIGPARVLPRTMVFTGILLAATCCGVDYGLHWLTEVLQGCAGASCDGDCMTLYNCCPPEEMTPECFADEHRRSVRRVVLVDGPNVVARSGTGCTAGECSIGADILTVEFTLVAATPWLWSDPVPVAEFLPLAINSGDECVTWCINGTVNGATCVQTQDFCGLTSSVSMPVSNGPCSLTWPVDDENPCEDQTCRFLPCEDVSETCADTRCAPPTPPSVTVPDTCFCLPLAVERTCCEMDLTDFPAWSADAPIITIRSGGTELRNITVTFYERTANHENLSCAEIAEKERCNPHSVYVITFVPAGGAVTIDGQIQRAIVECGGVCESSPDVYGADGAPISWAMFGCASYCICVEVDVMNSPSPDSLITISMSGRGY